MQRWIGSALMFSLIGCNAYDAKLLMQSDMAEQAQGAAGSGLPASATADDDAGKAPPPTKLCQPNPEAGSGCREMCPEICNGKDDDCDGRSDEGAAEDVCSVQHAQGVCLTGTCYIAKCLDGARDCDQNPANGCEIGNNDAKHCGACSTACSVTNGDPACNDGVCGIARCHAGYADCDGDPSACETHANTLTDCGDCRVACNDVPNAAPSCESGSCGVGHCNAGYDNCDDRDDNGCETPLNSLEHCGGCDVRCDKASCAGGVCTRVDCGRTPGFADCDRDELTCEIDLRADANNCGRCGFRCEFNRGVTAHGTLGCTPQGCKPSCDAGYGDCDGDYRNGCEQQLNTVAHCGRCGNGCNFANAAGSCVSGSCQLMSCNQNNADCDGDKTSCETAINTPNNCGSCGNQCRLAHATPRCPNRNCEIASCESNWEDCDANPGNGCERDIRAPNSGGAGPCLPDVNCTKASNNGSDYYFCTGKRSWADARSRCKQQRNGDLVQIGDANEANFIRSRISENVWIGLNDMAVEGLWVSASSSLPIWQGGSIDNRYSNWANGEPNGSGDCGQLYMSGSYDDHDCNATQAFVCETIPDGCPNDSNKIESGQCGCGNPDTDNDGDGFANCKDMCPNDAAKRTPGACGCGMQDVDSDGDDAADCAEACDADPLKQDPGQCGCGMPDTDSDGDGTANCKDGCPNDASTTSACFPYTPSNFDPGAVDFGNAPNATLNCGTTTIDTTPGTPTLDNWCGNAPPRIVQNQNSGPAVVIVPLRGLTIAQGSTLRLVGNRPVLLAVIGDVSIDGSIDASADGATPGAGGNWSCGASAGGNGQGDNLFGAGGGGGGGYGTQGGPGGNSTGGERGNPGGTRGNGNISPLLGGCNGGLGGRCDNVAGAAGGGAVQISATGNVRATGSLSADGGFGSRGCGNDNGATGGGSGGAVLIEARSLDVGSATLSARGGDGGSSDGNGGRGATNANSSGDNGGSGGLNGGGGGGGGYGRIRTVTR